MQSKAITVGDLVSATRQELIRVGYTESSRRELERAWNQLEGYVRTRRIEHFSWDVAREFLEHRYQIDIDTALPLSASNEDRLRAINLLLDFQNRQAVSIRRKRKHYRFARQFQQPFDDFMHPKFDNWRAFGQLRMVLSSIRSRDDSLFGSGVQARCGFLDGGCSVTQHRR